MLFDERSIREWIIILIGAIVAIHVGASIVDSGPQELGILIAIVFIVVWTMLAGDYWWLPVLIGATGGGSLYFGFRIEVVSVTLAMAVLALVPLFLLKQPDLYQAQRRPLTIFFYILIVYITVRDGVSWLHASRGGFNILRAAFDTLWPFIFALTFYAYGKTSILRTVLIGVGLFGGFRVAGVVAGQFYPGVLYIPGINYVITSGPSHEDSFLSELRTISFHLMAVLLIFQQASRTFMARLVFLPLLLAMFYIILQGGSRANSVLLMLLPLFFFAAARRWGAMGLIFSAAVGTFLVVNFNPVWIETLPPAIERTLSGLVVKDKVLDIQVTNEGSTLWHEGLRKEGLRRLTASPEAMVFGSDLKGFRQEDYVNRAQANQDLIMIEASADLGAYESGLWAVLATLGVAGYALYFVVFYSMWRVTVPYLVRNRVRTVQDGFIFWATFLSIEWYITGWTVGGFPSLELTLMVIAYALVQDQEAAARAEAEVVPKPEELVSPHALTLTS